ncbi:hypothetical protein ACED34_23515 [Vibrio splendidus]|uniref:hypothetical protein n=1 Tax=Vibrio TaxID=662 RepID=UPI0006A5B899|nr:hypothetical protein [Vibrio parahaemolyticus]KOE74859.1 hypothetical protein ACS87_20520 [Vibrio parahaemolyticus]
MTGDLITGVVLAGISVVLALIGWLARNAYQTQRERIDKVETSVNHIEKLQSVDNDRWQRQEKTNDQVSDVKTTIAVVQNEQTAQKSHIDRIEDKVDKIDEKMDRVLQAVLPRE